MGGQAGREQVFITMTSEMLAGVGVSVEQWKDNDDVDFETTPPMNKAGDVEVTSDTDKLFGPNGDLISADRVATVTSDDEPETAEELLFLADKGTLKRINDMTDDGATTWEGGVSKKELVERHAKKVIAGRSDRDVEDIEFTAPILGLDLDEGGSPYELTLSQAETEEKFHADDGEDWSPLDGMEIDGMNDECPECGEEAVESRQMQIGGADEGFTSLHTCGECGYKWRGGY